MTIGSTASLLFAGQILIGSLPAHAQDEFRPLTPAEKHAFHACLYTAYIDDYCRNNSQPFLSPQAFGECVIAHGTGRFPVSDRPYWTFGIQDYCRALAQTHR
jgi:hypothetical protein